MDDWQPILNFWLTEVGPEGWYKPPEGLDARIRDLFAAQCDAAREGRLDSWATHAGGTLALLILLDQFPRNVWRGTARAFGSDHVALRVAKAAIGRGLDLNVPEPQRQFFYLPLEHSESLADQERCVRLMLMRLPEGGADILPYAILHREVIRRFGRFPSRNAALGRPDTAAEVAYRAEGGYMS